MSKLTRGNGPIMGVCAGIADHLGISAIIVRVLWVILTPFSIGANLVIYIVAALVLPKPDKSSQNKQPTCRNCGTQNVKTSSFCKSCGKPM